MSTPQHTPGPWKFSDRWGNFGDYNRHENDAPIGQVSKHSYSVADEEGFIIAHCTNPLVTMSSDRSEANARLIAAAPELLHELQKAHRHLRKSGYDMTGINAAITKAQPIDALKTDAPTH